MCLSWIVTPWLRYTCWTSSTRCCWSASTPSTRSFSCGFTEPSVSCWPTSTASPSLTVRRARYDTGYSTSSPVSSVTRMRRTRFSSSSSMLDGARQLGDLRLALGLAGLEQLDHARQTVRDVLAGDAAGVERAHRELRAGLADGLRGDDADRLADVDHPAARERASVAQPAHADLGLARGDRADLDRLDAGLDDRGGDLVVELARRPARSSCCPTFTSSANTRPNSEVSMCALLASVPSGRLTFTRIGTERSVPQSSSRMMSSCATSTRRLVR